MKFFLRNAGILDDRAWSVFGLSAKETSSPIGYFGTGLKNAIAVLLRENIDITIYLGTDPIRFVRRPDSMRGTNYEQIGVTDATDNYQMLPFTLDLGKNWEVWQALRELVSNARDEPDWECGVNQLIPTPGYTTIELDGLSEKDIGAVSSIFLDDEAAWKTPKLEIHDRPSKYVYYRGVRAYELQKPSLLTYNVLDSYVGRLTEDRTIYNIYSVGSLVRDTLLNTNDVDLAEKILAFEPEHWEDGIEWQYGGQCSKIVKILLSNRKSRHNSNLNAYAVSLIPSFENYVEVDLSVGNEKILEKAKALCRALDFNPERCTIKVASGMGNKERTKYDEDNEIVYLNISLFAQGEEEVAQQLLYRMIVIYFNSEHVVETLLEKVYELYNKVH